MKTSIRKLRLPKSYFIGQLRSYIKYNKNKLELNEIASANQGFNVLVKFGLALIYRLKFIVKSHFQLYWEKNIFNFSFEKHVPSQVFIDFSVENLETTSSNFLLKFFSETYLSPIISYWGSIFT